MSPDGRRRDACGTAVEDGGATVMEKVPKIVEERLKAKAIAVEHPDADLLTAFSERALRERERTQVLEHLARCAECREVIALGLPVEEPLTATVPPLRGSWLTWPRMRWALVAAGVVIVGAFGVARYRATSHPSTVARYVAPRTEERAKQAETQPALPSASDARTENSRAIASGVPAKRETNEQSKEFDRLEGFAKLQSSPSQAAGVRRDTADFRSRSLAHGPKPPMEQWQQSANLNANANNQQQFVPQAPTPAPAPPPAAAGRLVANEAVVADQSAPASKTGPVGGRLGLDEEGQKSDTVAVQNRSIAPLSGGNSGAEVARAKDAQPPAANAETAYAYDISAANSSNFSPSGSLAPETSRWAINSVGGLQRSLDQGKTWQEVDVNNGLGASAGMSMQLAMKKSANKVANKEKADTKLKPIVFRAVAANGPDVWAGGSEGNLYHSTDAGDHWLRVVPEWRGIELTSDVLSLQFADAQHGRIVTSAAEIWTTADGGRSWDKQ